MSPIELARAVSEKEAQYIVETGRQPKRVYVSSDIIRSVSEQMRWTRDTRECASVESQIAGLPIVEVTTSNHIEVA